MIFGRASVPAFTDSGLATPTVTRLLFSIVAVVKYAGGQ
jgi:hypothetical protein